MSKTLEIYWDEKLVGTLEHDDHGELSFSYMVSYLNDPEAVSISCSLPLREKKFKALLLLATIIYAISRLNAYPR